MVRAKAINQRNAIEFWAYGHFLRIVLFALFAALVTSGCTRKEATTSIEITLPDFQAISNAKLSKEKLSEQGSADAATTTVTKVGRVMINVIGEGITPARVVIWERRDDLNRPDPTSFALEIPQGRARLFQVLIITKELILDSTYGQVLSEGEEKFLYGDVLRDLSSSVESVSIPVSDLGINSSGAEGVISGQILDRSPTGSTIPGPTGKVLMKFIPPNGRPPMIVENTEIHGGWFTFFAKDGLKFRYELASNGRNLLPFFESPSNPGVSLNTQQVVNVRTPVTYRSFYLPGSDTPLDKRKQSANSSILGYFGDGVVRSGTNPHQVCFSSTESEIESDIYIDDSGTTLLSWAGRINDSTASTKAGVFGGGGIASDTGECSGILFQNWLKVLGNRASDGHGIGGFRGAFQPMPRADGQWDFLQVRSAAAAGTLDLKLKYLPGVVGPGRITGIQFFTRTLQTPPNDHHGRDYEESDGIACNRLSDLGFSSSSSHRFPASPDSIFEQTVQLNGIDQAAFEERRVEIILCPFSDSRPGYFNAGLDYSPSGGGSSGGGSVRKEIKLTVASNVALGTCTTVDLEYFENGVKKPAADTEFLSVEVRSENGLAGLYETSAECSSASGTPVQMTTLDAGTDKKTIYFKGNTAEFTEVIVRMSDGYQTQRRVAVFSNTSIPTQLLIQSRTENLVQGMCYDVDYILMDGSGLANNASQTLALTDTGSGTFHADDLCSVTLPSLQFGSGEAFKKIFFKPSTTATGAQVLSTTSGALTIYPLNYTLESSVVTSLALRTHGQNHEPDPTIVYPADRCFEAWVQPLTSNNQKTRVATDSSISVSSPSGTFKFSTDNCRTLSDSISVTVKTDSKDGSSQLFYVKAINSEVTSGQIKAEMSASLYKVTTIYREPDQISVSSYASNNAFMNSFCHKLTVKALKSGSVFTTPIPLFIDLKPEEGNFELFTDENCTNQNYDQFIDIAQNTETQKYVWIRASGPFKLRAELNDSPNNIFNTFVPSSVTPYLSIAQVKSGIFPAGACMPLAHALTDGSNTFLPTETYLAEFSFPSGDGGFTDGKVYSDANCSNQTANSYLPGNETLIYYLKLADTIATTGSFNFAVKLPHFGASGLIRQTQITCSPASGSAAASCSIP